MVLRIQSTAMCVWVNCLSFSVSLLQSWPSHTHVRSRCGRQLLYDGSMHSEVHFLIVPTYCIQVWCPKVLPRVPHPLLPRS